jgi:hypothetical protein
VKVNPLLVVGLLVFAPDARGDDDWTGKLIARTDDIAKEVSKLRGLKIKKPIRRDVMDVDHLRERLLTRFGEEYTDAEMAAEQLALERWGLVPHGLDVHDVLLDVLTEQIAGFYDPADGTLYIAARPAGSTEADLAWADMLMAHEIVHALQDQHFDLEKLTDLPRTEADAQLARQALVEGDGVVAMVELVLARQGIAPPWGMEDAVAMMTGTMQAAGNEPGEDQLSRAPLVVRDLLMFPYAAGMKFVATIRARHPWKRVDQVFKDPPQSTEQILHPELYLAKEAPHRVTARTPNSLKDWRVVDETVWGEAGWSVLLRQHGVENARATAAAAGWGGDRVLVYAAADRKAPRDAVGVGLTSWDADIDAMEFEEAAIDAIDRMVTGTVIEHGKTRTVWLGVDARVSIVERREDEVLVVVGAPLAAEPAIADEVWKTWKVKR